MATKSKKPEVRKRKTKVKLKAEELPAPEVEVATIEVPDALGLVEHYSYVNHTRVAATRADVRIAAADLNPASKKLSGVTGIVMSHAHARDFVRALKSVVDSLTR